MRFGHNIFFIKIRNQFHPVSSKSCPFLANFVRSQQKNFVYSAFNYLFEIHICNHQKIKPNEYVEYTQLRCRIVDVSSMCVYIFARASIHNHQPHSSNNQLTRETSTHALNIYLSMCAEVPKCISNFCDREFITRR